jgi:hypothetical protein
MKKIITMVAVMLFVIAVGSVLADQIPSMTEGREVGILLNMEAPGKVISAPAHDFGRPLVSEELVDVGTALYKSAFETTLAEGIHGAAAGGVAKEDENTRIWNNLLGAPGGSDLP